MWYYPCIAVATLFDGYITEVLFIAKCAKPVFLCGDFVYQFFIFKSRLEFV